ncbi:MAG TPA: CYTH domain-containing protein [Rhizobiaceae bacterium]|nr:CYTH domain-containing protein [Rhizobiaceae bacterium]
MATEIERKFLVDKRAIPPLPDSGEDIVQAYVMIDDGRSARVRILDDTRATLTLKFAKSARSRHEFEYTLPLGDARDMLQMRIGNIVEKRRYRIANREHVIELDVFAGACAGLVVAEIELRAEDDEPHLPDWIGREVTGESRWSNQSLALNGLPEKPR